MSERDQRQAPRLTIRRGMDVYDTDQSSYIGSVIDVVRAAGHAVRARDAGPKPEKTNDGHVLGEELGPFPTIAAGNSGPVNQSAAHGYATGNHDTNAEVTAIVVRPGHRNPLARPLHIPFEAVRSIAMDRLILDVKKSDMPRAWSSRQAVETMRDSAAHGGTR
jgi:sporulation protein YlmC with PRC-barrel domain